MQKIKKKKPKKNLHPFKNQGKKVTIARPYLLLTGILLQT